MPVSKIPGGIAPVLFLFALFWFALGSSTVAVVASR